MRRHGHILEEAAEYPNMNGAFDAVLSGTKRKRCRQGKQLLANREEVLAQLADKILSGEFRISGYRDRDIIEAGKLRHLQILTMYDRIGIFSVMAVGDGYLRKRFIRTTGASIKGRGMHDLMKRIHDDMRNDPDGTRYCYVFDIVKCYERTSQAIAKTAIRRVFKEPKLLAMLDSFIEMLDEGLSLGLRSSQGIVNLILSVFLDHPIKSGRRVKYYYRYCDNGQVLSGSKKELWEIRDFVHLCLESIGYEIHNERVFPVSEGLDALGYVIFPDHVLIRKRIKQKFARKMGHVKSRKRRKELVASFYGMAKHAQCNMLFNKLTGKNMKSFKDLNVAYRPEDGKKRFPGQAVSIRELVNLPIIVRDFELGIKTAQGEDRCVVSIEVNGEPKKFFTNSEEMKNILAQVSEMPDGFPFETTIRSESFGKGKTKYIFT